VAAPKMISLPGVFSQHQNAFDHAFHGQSSNARLPKRCAACTKGVIKLSLRLCNGPTGDLQKKEIAL
jgi:hypothetical protein